MPANAPPKARVHLPVVADEPRRYRNRADGYNPDRAGTFEPVGWVPKTRGDCPTERPCVHIRCRHHLWFLEGRDRGGRYLAGDTLIPLWLLDDPPPSCSLDVADRGPHMARQIAPMLGLTSGRAVELVVNAAHARLRRKVDQLRDELGLEDAGPASLLAAAQDMAPGTIGVTARAIDAPDPWYATTAAGKSAARRKARQA